MTTKNKKKNKNKGKRKFDTSKPFDSQKSESRQSSNQQNFQRKPNGYRKKEAELEAVEVKIDYVNEDGQGVAVIDNDHIPVNFLLKNEVAEIKYKKNGKFFDSSIVKIVEKSKDRVTPPCRYYSKCGGCQLMHMSYPAQLKHKSGRVKKIMIGHDVDKIIGMDDPWHYRNKCISSFSFNKIVSSGFYQMYSHDIVNIAECKVQQETIDPIIETINQLATSGKLRIYNEDTENGFLRHVQIRTGFKSKEVMVVIVAANKIFPGKNKFIKALIERHPEIKTVILNVNKRTTSIVLGEQEIVLYGPGYIRDELCGLKFNISAKSFYQINPVQTEKLYDLALEMANLNEDDIVVDTYSGIGTITLIAAQKAKQVFGVEISKDAIKNSIRNAKLNKIKNVQFVEGDAGEIMVQMAEEEVPVTTVFMDPPRAGSDEQFLTSLVQLKPKQIIYISCNPVTQKRDMDYLLKKGYRVEKLVPVDMFPMTNHVESIAKLVRKK